MLPYCRDVVSDYSKVVFAATGQDQYDVRACSEEGPRPAAAPDAATSTSACAAALSG